MRNMGDRVENVRQPDDDTSPSDSELARYVRHLEGEIAEKNYQLRAQMLNIHHLEAQLLKIRAKNVMKLGELEERMERMGF